MTNMLIITNFTAVVLYELLRKKIFLYIDAFYCLFIHINYYFDYKLKSLQVQLLLGF